MTKDKGHSMSPQDGIDAIVRLIGDVGKQEAANGLDGFTAIFDRLEGIAAATGVEVPGLAKDLDALRAANSDNMRRMANIDAAVWSGDLARANDLLESGGVSVPDVGCLPLALCAEDGELCDDDDDGAAQEADEVPDLYAGIVEGRAGAIDALLATGVNLDAPSGPSGHTALLAALDAPGRSVDQIRRLVAAGADPKVVHWGGDNAISWAMGYHHPDTVTLDGERSLIAYLAEEGVAPDIAIPGQWVTLHRAIIQGGAPRLAALLALGIDVDTPAFAELEPGKLAHARPVMLAAPKPDCLRLLLDAGSEAGRPDALGRDPLDFVAGEAAAAAARARADDPWTVAHAEALEASRAMLAAHLGR